MKLITGNEVARKLCLNTVCQFIFWVDKPSGFTELEQSRAYMNGANAGTVYETHSCLFMSRRNTNRGGLTRRGKERQLSNFFPAPREALLL
jgi:hypothetical protein